jgi:hypothetical protein
MRDSDRPEMSPLAAGLIMVTDGEICGVSAICKILLRNSVQAWPIMPAGSPENAFTVSEKSAVAADALFF